MVDAFVFEREAAEHFPAQSLFIKLYAVERSADLVFRLKYLDIGLYFGIRWYLNSVGISDYYVQQFRYLCKEIFICNDDQLPAFMIRAEPSLIASLLRTWDREQALPAGRYLYCGQFLSVYSAPSWCFELLHRRLPQG